jgi:hypothetical protein
MVRTLSRISLVTAALIGLTGAATARDSASEPRTMKPMKTLKSFKPAYQANSNVAGTPQPYSWPVSDRYRPVSQPYFGRAF